MWNSTLPKEGWLYLLLKTKDQSKALVKGEDLISKEEYDSLMEYHKALLSLSKVFNKEGNKDFSYGQRGRFDQSAASNPFSKSDINEITNTRINEIEGHFV